MNVSDQVLLKFALQKLEEGKKVGYIVIIERSDAKSKGLGRKIVLSEDGEYVGSLGYKDLDQVVILKALDIIKKGLPTTISISFGAEAQDPNVIKLNTLCGSGVVKVFVDVLHPQQKAIVVGLKEPGETIAKMLKMLGYTTVAVELERDCKEYAHKDFADEFLCKSLHDVVKELTLRVKLNDIVVLVHGKLEEQIELIKAVIHNVRYVFMMGSVRKIKECVKKLIEGGISKEVLVKRFRAPMGLDIEALTPFEIAISFLAELIALRRGFGDKQVSFLNNVPNLINET